MKKSVLMLGFSALVSLGFSASETPSNSGYAIVNKFHLDGEGGWDYCALDDATSRLFVSHETQVQVMDVSTGKQIGAIADTKGVHGIAFAYEVKKAFISNGKDTSVSIVDLKTLALIKKVHVTGIGPDAIVYEPFSRCVFTFNGKTNNATVIGVKTDKVVATIALDGKPEFPASDGAGYLFDNIEDKNEVAVINTKSMKVEKTWPIAPGEGPSALSIDNRDHRLFIGCHNKLMVVMDDISGKVITSLPIGDHVDAAAFDAGKQIVYFSNGEGTVTAIQKSGNNDYKVLENIATQKGAKTMALSATSHHLYLPTAEFNPAPAPTSENPKPKATLKPGTFVVLDVAPIEK